VLLAGLFAAPFADDLADLAGFMGFSLNYIDCKGKYVF
jgi:hypothetical protein